MDIFFEDGLEVGVFIFEEMKYKNFLNLLLLDLQRSYFLYLKSIVLIFVI